MNFKIYFSLLLLIPGVTLGMEKEYLKTIPFPTQALTLSGGVMRAIACNRDKYNLKDMPDDLKVPLNILSKLPYSHYLRQLYFDGSALKKLIPKDIHINDFKCLIEATGIEGQGKSANGFSPKDPAMASVYLKFAVRNKLVQHLEHLMNVCYERCITIKQYDLNRAMMLLAKTSHENDCAIAKLLIGMGAQTTFDVVKGSLASSGYSLIGGKPFRKPVHGCEAIYATAENKQYEQFSLGQATKNPELKSLLQNLSEDDTVQTR